MLITIKTKNGASVDIFTARETLAPEHLEIAVLVAQRKSGLSGGVIRQDNALARSAWSNHARLLA